MPTNTQETPGALHRRITAQLRTTIATGLVAAALSLGIGLAVFGAAAATVTVAAGGLGVAYGACQSIEAGLAADLRVSIATLRTLESTSTHERLAAQRAAGILAPGSTQHDVERTAAYANCRQTFTSPSAVSEAE